jgi:hypothetical protein
MQLVWGSPKLHICSDGSIVLVTIDDDGEFTSIAVVVIF